MGDLISRQEAIKEAERIIGKRASFKAYAIVDMLRKLDAEEPNKTGRWKYSIECRVIGNPYGSYECNLCGDVVAFDTNYCSRCGAQMEGVDI